MIKLKIRKPYINSEGVTVTEMVQIDNVDLSTAVISSFIKIE